MTVNVRDIIAKLEEMAPRSLAMQGDPVGLQVGTLDKPAEKVWLALDPSPDVIAAAIRDRADLLITHHALLYRPLRQVDTRTVRGRAIAAALANDLTVYAAHTNLDIAEGGVNDVIAQRLGLSDVEILDRLQTDALRKLVVFVPEGHQDAVANALFAAGAGHIGNYSHCSFQTPGTGTFLPQDGTNPYLGEVGRLERANEIRLETIVPEPMVERAVSAMLEAHPYEEVAYDVYSLEIMGKPYGIGRVGNLPTELSLEAFAEQVRDTFGLAHIRFGGNPVHRVRRVAVLGGSGGKWVSHALAKGADVLVTADCDHHVVAEAWQDGLAIVDATHAALERPVLRGLQEKFRRTFPEVEFVVADVTEDPFHWR